MSQSRAECDPEPILSMTEKLQEAGHLSECIERFLMDKQPDNLKWFEYCDKYCKPWQLYNRTKPPWEKRMLNRRRRRSTTSRNDQPWHEGSDRTPNDTEQ